MVAGVSVSVSVGVGVGVVSVAVGIGSPVVNTNAGGVAGGRSAHALPAAIPAPASVAATKRARRSSTIRFALHGSSRSTHAS